MKQIFIAIKKGKHFHLTHIFANRPETFSETRLRDKELWDPGYSAKTDTIPVSYTHLTLPTNREV